MATAETTANMAPNDSAKFEENLDHSTTSMEKSSGSRNRSSSNSFSAGDDSAGVATPHKSGAASIIQDVFAVDRSGHHVYITGLRGVLVIQSFIWTYFQTFIPTLVSRDTPGPVYQDLLREILSVPLWNQSLIYNFFIILSMRTIAVSFLKNPTGQSYAATIIRRNVRMVIILCAGSGMATLIFSRIGVGYIDEFKTKLPNESIMTPTTVYDGGAAFNSLFNLFWLTYDHYKQAANMFWPTATLWVPSIIYFQSYTVYFLMVILPFSRPKWHISGLGLFALGSFWMGYWGWYSVTGLIFADLAINATLKAELKAGLKVRDDWRIPYAAIAPMLFAIGIAFKYAFIVRPQYMDKLLVLHPYLDISTRYSPSTTVEAGPYARLDDWFVITGILLALELFENAQYYLSFKPLVYLGERSFGIFVAQCIFFWTGGIKLWLVLRDERGLSTASANGVIFLVGFLAVFVFAELFFRLIDAPSIWLAKKTYTWLVN
ncbi:hypothetical protein CKM354_000456500 [Cercospora kikuchii]|uniref:Uncharacterized protein n=1 Tax=Cercospora kikuchii TaxID=84275 RepID=A0A9P3FBL5_9PEZI|nr:uncharacterized protein CKM354_000456500 [Cercospora kikuchii]GIZ41253.1 hypothetical protein CKM354_000456500 [Cercospora kikuchii]